MSRINTENSETKRMVNNETFTPLSLLWSNAALCVHILMRFAPLYSVVCMEDLSVSSSCHQCGAVWCFIKLQISAVMLCSLLWLSVISCKCHQSLVAQTHSLTAQTNTRSFTRSGRLHTRLLVFSSVLYPLHHFFSIKLSFPNELETPKIKAMAIWCKSARNFWYGIL